FNATGEWMDGKTIVCGPGGTRDGKFHIGEVSHLAGSLAGKVEKLYRKILRNDRANFMMTRREESAPWFGLVGVIANGVNPGGDGTPPGHQIFFVGETKEVRPERPGYLYCFANDAWGFYENNRGSVTLEVARTS